MPTSDPANKLWTIRKIKQLNPSTVLDVGAGMGDYLELIKTYMGDEVKVDAIEVWQPYVEKYKLKERYDNLFVLDAREFNDFKYDLVICGDVLEHMSENDAVELWNKISKSAKNAIISIPIIYHPQDEYDNNPYEVHVEENWNVEKVLNKFYGIYEHKKFDITGVFLAEFK